MHFNGSFIESDQFYNIKNREFYESLFNMEEYTANDIIKATFERAFTVIGVDVLTENIDYTKVTVINRLLQSHLTKNTNKYADSNNYYRFSEEISTLMAVATNVQHKANKDIDLLQGQLDDMSTEPTDMSTIKKYLQDSIHERERKLDKVADVLNQIKVKYIPNIKGI